MKQYWTASAIATTIALVMQAPIARAAEPPPSASQAHTQPVAREGAPNVLIWLLDDVGFAQFHCFGGIVDTPNIDRVAKMGLRYSNYHTPSICSATRAALLTGRNNHSVHLGGHVLYTRNLPGYDGIIPLDAGSLAENLRQNGYATYALGKWDNLPPRDSSPGGPFNYFPLGQGFDRYYGFISADVDNFSPILWRDNQPIATPKDPRYHLNEDLADKAIEMIRSRQSQYPTRPFFMYWATGTAHAPHHAPAEYLQRYRGKFDMGWDKARQMVLKRQIAQGLVPATTKLAPRPETMPAWDSLTSDQKRLYARQMEAFAASIAYADAEFGRILDAIDAQGELDNTMIIVTTDNGASAEGAASGTYSEDVFRNGRLATDAENMKYLDKWGGPETYPHYAMGWAVAGNTPFRYYKQTTHEGGIHVPMVMAWPKGIAARGELRNQFVHVTDIAATILDASKSKPAEIVNGLPQRPLEGSSFTYTFSNPKAPDQKQVQYFEMYGNRGLWAGGWKAVTSHRLRSWIMTEKLPFSEPWELYDLRVDPGETHNLAASNPAKVAEMARLFDEEAKKYNVYPLGNMADSADYQAQIFQQDFKARGGQWVYKTPVSRLGEGVAPPILRRGYTATVKVGLDSGKESGPIFAMGGAFGGLSFYLKDGRPGFLLKQPDLETTVIESPAALSGGTTDLTLEVLHAPTVAAVPVETTVRIMANGKPLVSRTLPMTFPLGFLLTEVFDIGTDSGTTAASYPAETPLNGTITDLVFDFDKGS